MSSAQPILGDRSLFPDLSPAAYLHHAGISPLSAPVVAAIADAAAQEAAQGALAFGPLFEVREALRGALAQLVGGQSDEIALLANTAAGLNAVAWGFPFAAGDRIVVFDGEYPSNVLPFLRVAERVGLSVERLSLAPFADPAGPDFSALDAALARGPRLLAVSAVQFQTGLRMPLGEIAQRCRARGVRVCVDGVQACGAVPLDVGALDIDYLACGSHKWLMGPAGGGFLWARPEAMAELRPAIVGAMGYAGTLAMLREGEGHLRYDHPPLPGPRMLETGMVSSLSFAGLSAAVQLLLSLGPDAILQHTLAYGDALEAGLLARGFRSLRTPDVARRSAILALSPPAGAAAHVLTPALAERGVVCGCPDGKLRFAPHFANRLSEVDTVLAAVDDALAAG